ncbi:MAG: DUF2071 domain-containing protein [Bacteroidetes bacterium]|nr:DUF2071 domain-containing protein [Bacteroidota bacterium]
MLDALKNHPFGVTAHLKRTVVLAFAVPRSELQKLLPPYLDLDVFQEEHGFLAVAMVETRRLRPMGFPEWAGLDFFLLGYRVFVRHVNVQGKRLRGLYILGSETDKRLMARLGNVFTHYGYAHKPIDRTYDTHRLSLRSKDGSMHVSITDNPDIEEALPVGSPFADWKEARRYVGPLPFTFSYDAKRRRMLTVEGSRVNWTPRPVQVERWHFSFLDRFGFSDLRLANAFTMNDVPYQWKRGTLEPMPT